MPLFVPARGVETGTIIPFGSTTISSDYLLCDGSAVSRTIYSDLFATIGIVFGAGDGSTTFNIPDLRQRFVLGRAASGTGATFGATGGVIDHTHNIDPPSTATGGPSATVAATALTGSAASPTHTHNVDISGFASGVTNPPWMSLVYIIRI